MGLSFKNMKKAVEVVVEAGHVPNIVGLQGIGKSDLVREFAYENDYAFAEVTCSLLQEGDLALPYLSGDGNRDVSYAVNKIITNLEYEGKNKKYAILFLDEFNRASTQTQSELMNLVLQRAIAGYKLADNVRVILAMNPSSEMSGYEDSDYSVSFSDSAIMGRVLTLDMVPVLGEWLLYGEQIVNGRSRVHPVVSGYLSINDKEFTTKEQSGLINNTPRGWSRISDVLYSYEDLGIRDTNLLLNMMKGTLESNSANRLLHYYKSNSKTVNYKSVALSTLRAISTDKWDSSLFNMSDVELDKVLGFMLDYVSSGINDDTAMPNMAEYISAVPMELSYSWISSIQQNYQDIYEKLLDNEEFSSYALGLLVNVSSMEVGGFVGKG